MRTRRYSENAVPTPASSGVARVRKGHRVPFSVARRCGFDTSPHHFHVCWASAGGSRAPCPGPLVAGSLPTCGGVIGGQDSARAPLFSQRVCFKGTAVLTPCSPTHSGRRVPIGPIRFLASQNWGNQQSSSRDHSSWFPISL